MSVGIVLLLSRRVLLWVSKLRIELRLLLLELTVLIVLRLLRGELIGLAVLIVACELVGVLWLLGRILLWRVVRYLRRVSCLGDHAGLRVPLDVVGSLGDLGYLLGRLYWLLECLNGLLWLYWLLDNLLGLRRLSEGECLSWLWGDWSSGSSGGRSAQIEDIDDASTCIGSALSGSGSISYRLGDSRGFLHFHLLSLSRF